MKILILFGLLAIVCAAPTQESEEFSFDKEEKEVFLGLLDLIEKTALITELDTEHLESEEQEKQSLLTVIDKIKAAVNTENWNELNILDEEQPAYLAVFEMINDLTSDDSGSQEEQERAASYPY